MEDIFVGQLMSSPVQTVAPETPIYEAADVMRTQDIGSVVVVDTASHPEGILTSTDFVQLAADRASPDDTRVEEYMNPASVTTTVNETIQDAADTMMDHNIHHLPVIDDSDGVIGIVTTTDLTAYLSPDWEPSPP